MGGQLLASQGLTEHGGPKASIREAASLISVGRTDIVTNGFYFSQFLQENSG